MIQSVKNDQLPSPPLVRWDDIHLVFDIPAVEEILRVRLSDVEALSNLELQGHDARLSLVLRVHWKGITIKVGVELREIRIRHRRLGFRLGRLRAFGGLPVPKIAVLRTLQRAMPELVTIRPGSDIVVVDLRRWIPPEISLRVVAVQGVGRGLHVWLASGSVMDVGRLQNEQLSAGNPEKSLPAEIA